MTSSRIVILDKLADLLDASYLETHGKPKLTTRVCALAPVMRAHRMSRHLSEQAVAEYRVAEEVHRLEPFQCYNIFNAGTYEASLLRDLREARRRNPTNESVRAAQRFYDEDVRVDLLRRWASKIDKGIVSATGHSRGVYTYDKDDNKGKFYEWALRNMLRNYRRSYPDNLLLKMAQRYDEERVRRRWWSRTWRY